MGHKVFLSPSAQTANTYAAGNTNEAEQCGRIAVAAKAALERCGLLDRAALVADCGLPTEQVYHDLRALPPTLSYFATILVR